MNNTFAVLNSMNEIVIYDQTGNELNTLKFDFYVNKIFGGRFLGLATSEFVMFYDWNAEDCIGKINVELEEIFWNEDLFIIKGPSNSFLLKFDKDMIGSEDDESEVFELLTELNDVIYSGVWVKKLFFYVSE